jgi:hypothetical protein
LTGGAGPSGHLSAKRGTEDLDFFIGDEALSAAAGPGYGIHYPIRHGQIDNWVGFDQGQILETCSQQAGSHGALLVKFHIQVSQSGTRRPLLLAHGARMQPLHSPALPNANLTLAP